jgi:hypothetical protein
MRIDEMNPDVRVMKLRQIRDKIARGEMLNDSEQEMYEDSKRKKWS